MENVLYRELIKHILSFCGFCPEFGVYGFSTENFIKSSIKIQTDDGLKSYPIYCGNISLNGNVDNNIRAAGVYLNDDSEFFVVIGIGEIKFILKSSFDDQVGESYLIKGDEWKEAKLADLLKLSSAVEDFVDFAITWHPGTETFKQTLARVISE